MMQGQKRWTDRELRDKIEAYPKQGDRLYEELENNNDGECIQYCMYSMRWK